MIKLSKIEPWIELQPGQRYEKQLRQIIQEWTKQILWKIAFKKIQGIWSNFVTIDSQEPFKHIR